MVVSFCTHELREFLISVFGLKDDEVDDKIKEIAKTEIGRLKLKLEGYGRWEHLKEPPFKAVQLAHEISEIQEEFNL